MNGIMQTSSLLAVLLVTLLSVWTVLGNDSLLPPNRPSRFSSPGQLRQYLKALNDYYAIVGRPRFGKRDSEFSSYDQEPRSDGILSSSRDREDFAGPQWW
ncbi:pro-neuropeptide Y isoform X1 [Magallana gigas]|uniref:pro-neuropeptide Y isoform X1 n=1 Tax=Magallana gigas TaxID=29159 RepID=UPI0005C360B9|eukprot:XP_011448178.1 PREDICTED: pro-neuropeptide Y-like [Crassostrea gigas]